MSAPRFAVFWRPPVDTLLGAALARWFADPATARLRRSPTRYGPHMTLFAPTPLAPMMDVAGMARAVAAIGAVAPPAPLPPLRLSHAGGFLALRPAAAAPAARRLAALCVRALDGLRGPSAPADYARRTVGAGDDAAALARLARWGYPWVLNGFAPHITLGDPSVNPAAAPEAARLFAGVEEVPVSIDRLTLMVEPRPGAAFSRLGEWACRGASFGVAP